MCSLILCLLSYRELYLSTIRMVQIRTQNLRISKIQSEFLNFPHYLWYVTTLQRLTALSNQPIESHDSRRVTEFACWPLPRSSSGRQWRKYLKFCFLVVFQGRSRIWTALERPARTWSGSTTSALTAGSPRSSWRGTAVATLALRLSGSTNGVCRRPSKRRTFRLMEWTSWAPTKTNPRADGDDTDLSILASKLHSHCRVWPWGLPRMRRSRAVE